MIDHDNNLKMYHLKNVSILSLGTIVMLLSAKLHGQNFDVGKSHQVSTSFGKLLLIDDHLDLKANKINLTGFNWSYNNATYRQQKSLTAGFQYANNVKLKTTVYAIEFKNAYSIFRNRQMNNYFGYSLKTSSQFLKANEKHSWVSVNSVSLYNSFNYSFGKNLIIFNASVPVVGFVSRPDPEKEYEGSLNSMLYNSLSNPKFSSFHNYGEINVLSRYSRFIGSKFSIFGGISYSNQKVKTGNYLEKEEYNFEMGLKYFVR